MKTYVILTATREDLGAGTDKINVTRNSYLKTAIEKNGLHYVPATGFYKGIDQGASFIVLCEHPQSVLAMRELAEDFQQESIIVDGVLEFITGPRKGQCVQPEAHIRGIEALKQPGYTLANGKYFSFVYPPGTF